MTLTTRAESQENARLLNEWLEADREYNALLPRMADVSHGEPVVPVVLTDEYLSAVTAAEAKLQHAKEALDEFERSHQLGG